MNDTATVKLGPELLIYQVSELKAELDQALNGLENGLALCLDAQDLADIDGAGLQLLAMLNAELAARGSSLTWQGLSKELAARIEDSGLAALTAVPATATAEATR